MSIRAKIVLNSVAIALFVAAAAYLYFAIDQLADEFIGLRKSDAQFFSQLIRDNWDGIRTIPEEKKKILVENLDPKWAGVDLEIFRKLLVGISLAFCAAGILDRAVALLRLWRTSRSQNNAP